MSIRLSGSDSEFVLWFNLLITPQDVAALLDIEYKDLLYYLYYMPDAKKYESFQIRKKAGGFRTITAPSISLKILQKKLLQVLSAVYKPKKCVHGFVKGRSIKTNASKHKNQRFVLNLDIKDFFPSINFGRVRGLFIAPPYNRPPSVATILAQICCFENQLPQGAPTSPIISNMICSRLDYQLQDLASELKCLYTRYGDDITFSTSLAEFPSDLAYMQDNETLLGKRLSDILANNGFEVQKKKVRLQSFNYRQEVTGITVNKFTNVSRQFVRQIRAMLHDWREHGLEKAQDNHLIVRKKHRHPELDPPAFMSVVRGKIAYLRMVRFHDEKADEIYKKFLGKYRILYKRDRVVVNKGDNQSKPIIPTSGKVFISYSRKDEGFARKLAENLSGEGEEVWIDTQDIPPGMKWSDAIDEGLKICDIMYLIISPDSLASNNVADEWEYFHNNKKPIIPIMLREVDDKLMPYQLPRIQRIDFSQANKFRQRFKELLKETYRKRSEPNGNGN